MMPKHAVEGGKRFPLNMRTTQEIREKLEAAARASGRSLTQEVEYRLERSFDRENWRAELLAELRAPYAPAMVPIQWRMEPGAVTWVYS